MGYSFFTTEMGGERGGGTQSAPPLWRGRRIGAIWPPTCSLVYAFVHVGRLLPPTSPLCAVHVSVTKIKKIIFSLPVIDALYAVYTGIKHPRG